MPQQLPETISVSKDLTFYPAYCFPASPTWFRWVKLTAYDIHHILRARPGFSVSATNNALSIHHDDISTAPGLNLNTYSFTPPPLLLFYLNHPIQFVQIVGIVVSLHQPYASLVVITLDDSSGATIEIAWKNPDDNITWMTFGQTAHSSEHASAQTIPEILSTLDSGTCIVAKGTLTTYRSIRQLTLHRLSVIRSTTEELTHISSRTSFLLSTLSKPWTLPSSQQKRLQADAEAEHVRDRTRARRRMQREEYIEGKVLAEWNAEEAKRVEEAEKARQNGEVVMQELTKRRNCIGRPREPIAET